jgi:hypothetical protein
MNGGIGLNKRFELSILFRRPFVSLVRRHEVTSSSPSARALGVAVRLSWRPFEAFPRAV